MLIRAKSFTTALLLATACGNPAVNPTGAAGSGKTDSYYTVGETIPRFATVIPGQIYRGGAPDQEGIESLATFGVQLDLDLDNNPFAFSDEAEWTAEVGLPLVHEPMSALRRPKDAQVERILEMMNDPANQPVFVHCEQGQDRTGVIVGLYRVLYQGWTPEDAYREMRSFGFRTYLLGLKHYFEDRTGWDE